MKALLALPIWYSQLSKGRQNLVTEIINYDGVAYNGCFPVIMHLSKLRASLWTSALNPLIPLFE